MIAPYQKRVDVTLGYEVTLRGETCSVVHVVEPLLKEIRAQALTEGPEDKIPSPWVRTPGGQFLSDEDLGDLTASDAARVAEAVEDFVSGRRQQAE